MSEEKGVISLKAWMIWLSAGLFYLYEFVLRASPGVITNDLMRDFHVMAGSLGILTSSYYYSYTPLQIPCGLIVDKIGPRKIVTFSALLCVIGSVVFASSSTLLQAQFGRVMIGAGSACAFISCVKLGSEWFPPSRVAVVIGLTNAMGTLGGTFASYPFAILAHDFGWRGAMLVCTVIGLVVALISWFVIRDRNPIHGKHDEVDRYGILDILAVLVRDKQFWLISIYSCLSYLPISVFCELWAVPFLMKIYDINNAVASKANITLYVGSAFGSVILASLSDFVQSRKKVMIGALMLVCLLLFLIIIMHQHIPLHIMYFLFFLIGFFTGAQVIGFACINELYSSRMSGTSAGFMNSIVTLGPVIVQPLFGFILDCMWDGNFGANGLPCYDLTNYQISMLVLLILIIIGVVALCFSRETFKSK